VSANPEPPQAATQAVPGLTDLSEQIKRARAQSAAAHPGANGTAPRAPGAGEASIPAPAEPSRRRWLDDIETAVSRLGTALARPPVRLAATGALLLVIAIVLVPGSVWTLPLVIAGTLMVLVAWIGSRLRGHVLLEWGETGARVDFHAEVVSAAHRHAPAAARQRPVIAAVPEREKPGVIGDLGRRR
jgi:hypothetical protein